MSWPGICVHPLVQFMSEEQSDHQTSCQTLTSFTHPRPTRQQHCHRFCGAPARGFQLQLSHHYDRLLELWHLPCTRTNFLDGSSTGRYILQPLVLWKWAPLEYSQWPRQVVPQQFLESATLENQSQIEVVDGLSPRDRRYKWADKQDCHPSPPFPCGEESEGLGLCFTPGALWFDKHD